MSKIRITLAGATGWAGSALAKGIARQADLSLVAAVSRKNAGADLGNVLCDANISCPVFASAQEALTAPSDVFFEYTKPDTAKRNILAALSVGRHVVVGTSGLTTDDYAEIDERAKASGLGVLAVGNFALTVVLLQKFAEIAARYIDHWEIIDYAHDDKIDAPSGTTRELAHRLSRIKQPKMSVPLDKIRGESTTRGATVAGSQIHSLRLPGYVIGAEIIFGMHDQKLIMRHEAGSSAEPYVAGALLAIRKVSTFVGLRRGLDTVMDL
jgi:4-hydroxy-tetrahydrodipicolinate reductase